MIEFPSSQRILKLLTSPYIDIDLPAKPAAGKAAYHAVAADCKIEASGTIGGSVAEVCQVNGGVNNHALIVGESKLHEGAWKWYFSGEKAIEKAWVSETVSNTLMIEADVRALGDKYCKTIRECREFLGKDEVGHGGCQDTSKLGKVFYFCPSSGGPSGPSIVATLLSEFAKGIEHLTISSAASTVPRRYQVNIFGIPFPSLILEYDFANSENHDWVWTGTAEVGPLSGRYSLRVAVDDAEGGTGRYVGVLEVTPFSGTAVGTDVIAFTRPTGGGWPFDGDPIHMQSGSQFLPLLELVPLDE